MSGDERERTDLMQKIVQKMDIMMTMPEDPIVEQEADPTAMPPNYEEDKNLGDND